MNMPTSVDHLPERKRAQLRAVTALIRNNTHSVEMVILFGSYARGDWVEDLATGYFSDFDILVVVNDPAEVADLSLWSRLTTEAHRITGHVSVNLLPLHFKEVNSEIRIGHYFFADVVAEGIWLYNSRNITLAKPKAKTPKERLALAEWNFKYWFESANGFWIGTGYYMSIGMRCHAAFLLHQSVERYYHAVLLVFKGTKPKCHNIGRLADDTAPLHEALARAMPRASGEEKRLFDLLKRAYIEARYSKSYRISTEELKVLRERAQKGTVLRC
jgi:predicted nucleotidyltransferase/HEPN domain-containing protein